MAVSSESSMLITNPWAYVPLVAVEMLLQVHCPVGVRKAPITTASVGTTRKRVM